MTSDVVNLHADVESLSLLGPQRRCQLAVFSFRISLLVPKRQYFVHLGPISGYSSQSSSSLYYKIALATCCGNLDQIGFFKLGKLRIQSQSVKTGKMLSIRSN